MLIHISLTELLTLNRMRVLMGHIHNSEIQKIEKTTKDIAKGTCGNL